MTSHETLRAALVAVEADGKFSEAVMRFRDGTRLCFCHRVGERWAKAVGPEGRESEAGLAGVLLAAVTKFRLNARHMDIAFSDGSRWDQPVRDGTPWRDK